MGSGGFTMVWAYDGSLTLLASATDFQILYQKLTVRNFFVIIKYELQLLFSMFSTSLWPVYMHHKFHRTNPRNKNFRSTKPKFSNIFGGSWPRTGSQLLSQDSPKIPKSHLKKPQKINNVETWWNLISKPINSSSSLKSSRGNIFFCGDRTICRWVRACTIFEDQNIFKKITSPRSGRAINFSLDMHVGLRAIYKDQTWNFKSKFRKLGVCRNSLLGCLVTYCWLPICMRRLHGGQKAIQSLVDGSHEFTLDGLLHPPNTNFWKIEASLRPAEIVDFKSH